MSQEELKLRVGDAVQLQMLGEENRARHYAKVIGYLHGQSVLITTPRVDGKIILVREGQMFAVRLLASNIVLGFTARILRVNTRPYPYLHLSYPQQVEQMVVRRAQRVAVRLPASVQNSGIESTQGKPVSVVIVDLSTGGAMLTAGAALGEVGDLVTVTTRIRVGSVEQQLTLPAVIRSVRVDEGARQGGRNHYMHGLEFQLVEQSDAVTLHGFVYEQLVNDMMK